MNVYKPTRREFLVTMAAASAYGFLSPMASVARAQGKQVLRVRQDRDIAILDPATMVGGSEIEVQFAVLPRLVEFNYSTGAVGPMPGATVQKIVQRDPTHIDFTLKDGFKWTNGFGDLTAEDVKYSYERMKTSDWSGYFDQMEKIEVKNKLSGTIVLKQPFAPFWLVTMAHGVGSIVSAKATDKAGGKFTTEFPATCGPYVYQWIPKQKNLFKPNPDWAGPKPDFDEVHGLLVEQDKAAILAYEAGEVDCSEITSADHARFKKSMPANSKIFVAGALQYFWLGMNTQHPKLQDIRVRRAIQYAVDVDSIIQGAYSGTVEKSFGPVCPGLVGKRQKTKYSYNPAKAKQLVQEAGATGLELELKTLNQQERVLAGQIIQANLQAVGIKVKVLPLDGGPFWALGQEKKGDQWKDSQLWLMRYGTNPDPYEAMQWFRREQIGVWNWERWSDDEFEELYTKGLAETDAGKRDRMYLRMQEIMEDTGAYVWICHEPETYIHNTRVLPKTAPGAEMVFSGFKKA